MFTKVINEKDFLRYVENLNDGITTTDLANLYGRSAKVFNQLLQDLGVHYKRTYNGKEKWILKKNFSNKNLMVVADVSGSMEWPNELPLANSIGLAIYIAERNKGAFKNHFITFSEIPRMNEVVGKDIVEKVNNIEFEIANTNIDEVFKLLLNTAIENKSKQDEMPTHLIIISDMEFNQGVYSKEGTNFNGWKKYFEENGYELPKVIFWNVSANTMGVPVTKFDSDVAMVSGFSTSVLENLLTLDKLTPMKFMLQTLEKYINLLGEVA